MATKHYMASFFKRNGGNINNAQKLGKTKKNLTNSSVIQTNVPKESLAKAKTSS